jgi:hypothetical protein
MPKRPIVVGETISTIRLTKGFETIVSNDKLPMVQGFNWHTHICNHKLYAVRHAIIAEGGNRKLIYMHRFLLRCPEGFECDHIDGNSLNNTNENLRSATISQNRMNIRHRRDNTTGVHGVCFSKRTGKFAAYIKLNRKQKHLGYFTTIEDARSARLAAKPTYHGEFGEI